MPQVIDVPVLVVDDGRQASFPRQASWGSLRPNAGHESPHPILSDTIFIPDGLGLMGSSFRIPNQQPTYEENGKNKCFRAASFGRPLSRSNSVPVVVSPAGLDDLSFGGNDRPYTNYSQWTMCQPGATLDVSQDNAHCTPRVPSLMPELSSSHAPPGHLPWQTSSYNGMSAPAGHPSTPGQAPWNMPSGNLTTQMWQPVGPPCLSTSSSFNSYGANALPPAHSQASVSHWPQYGGQFHGGLPAPTIDGSMTLGHAPNAHDSIPWLPNVGLQSSSTSGLALVPKFPNPDANLMAAARAALSLPLTSSASERFLCTSEGGENVRRRLSLSLASDSTTPQGTPTLATREEQHATRRPPAEVVHQPELPPSPSKPSKGSMSSPDSLIRKLASRPLLRTTRVQYPDGVVVDIPECVAALMSVVEANARYQRTMACNIENGELLRQAHKIYLDHDTDGRGYLTWQNGAVRDFIVSVFKHFRLVPPTETQIYHIYILFDSQRKMELTLRECLCMVDAILRATFIDALWGSPNGALTTDSNSNLHSADERNVRRGDNTKEFSDWDIPSETPSLSVDSSSHPRHATRTSFPAVHKSSRRRNSYHTHGQSNRSGKDHPHHSHGRENTLMPWEGHVDSEIQTNSPLRSPDLKAAAVAAAAAAAAAVAATKTRGEGDKQASGYMSGSDALTEAKAETARLRRELQELREIENAYALAEQEVNTKPIVRLPSPKPLQVHSFSSKTGCIGDREADDAPHQLPYREAIEDQSRIDVQHSPSQRTNVELQHSPSQRTCFQPLASPPDETLLWTARAHAENCRLERELTTLRDVAMRQRGEVQWLSSLKASGIEGRHEEKDASTSPLTIAHHEEEQRAKKEEIEDFTRRLRLLQQRERDFDAERESLLERERAVRDQELQLALENERQKVRSLMKERTLDQREWQLQKGVSAPDRNLEKDAKNHPPQEGVPLHGSVDRPGSRTFLLGSAYSAVDTEPEAEAEADIENEEWAVAAAENKRLRETLQGLRQIAQLQRGEEDALAARGNVAAERFDERKAPVDVSPIKQTATASKFQQTLERSQLRQGSCIPTVSSPGASPFTLAEQKESSRKENLGRSLFSRVSERSGKLAAAALAIDSTEQRDEGAMRRDLRHGVHQPFATRQGSMTSVTAR